jgi:hypothetical protein
MICSPIAGISAGAQIKSAYEQLTGSYGSGRRKDKSDPMDGVRRLNAGMGAL